MIETRFTFGKALRFAAVLAVWAVGHATSLAAGSYDNAFEELKQPAAMTNVAYQKEIIRENFLGDPEAGLPFLLQRLWNQPAARSYQQRQAAQMDLITVRAVLAEMPIAVQERVVQTDTDNAVNQARLIEVMGGLGTPLALERIEQALSDQRTAALPGETVDGWPLRVCDVAYSTLTHRLQPLGLRTPLSAAHSYAQRDRWIVKLKEWLATHRDEATTVFSKPG